MPLLLWLALASPARAEAPEPLAPPDPTPHVLRGEQLEPFQVVLKRALDVYFQGGHEEAEALLLGLQSRLEAGEDVPPEQAGEALIYLGEIYQVTGHALESFETFQSALERDPGLNINIYHHPPEVVNLFGLARREVIQAAQTPVAPPPAQVAAAPSFPWWINAPLGIPQLGLGQTRAGARHAAAQLALAGSSVVLSVHLHRWTHDDSGEYVEPPGSEYPAFTAYRAAQWATTIGTYAAWAASVGAARRSIRRSATLAVGESPEGTPTLGVGGTW
ncbi:MAG: hypothetical protein JXX28_11195 [Deltaproteobacteria bacterium]|nr:hypothetical protein [Deltaproteobacteria bacterium]